MNRTLFTISIWIITLGCGYCTEAQNETTPENNAIDNENEPLLLTPLIEAGKIKEAQDAAKVTDIIEMKNMRSYSGYLTVNKRHNSNLFFWFFLAQNNSESAPLVLWLQGGPGRSSLRGLLMENGPFDIGTGSLVARDATWTQDHNIIYLDSPVGAGFSNANEAGHHTNLTKIGEDIYSAIQQFYQLFPNFQKNEFFVGGQSYGGKFVPTIAHIIHKRNPKAKLKINLVGIFIGNGLVDPETQLQYSEYLYQIGLINGKGKKVMQVYEEKMIEFVRKKEWTAAYVIYTEIILNMRHSLYKNMTGFANTINMLEPKRSDDKEMRMTAYLSHPTIKRAIHAGNHTFHPYSSYIQILLLEDLMQSVAHLVSELVNHYKVMIYNGQLDIIIPYRSTANYLRKLTFNGVENYENAERIHWYVNSTLAGYATQVGNLIEVMVRNAGHSVPEDQIVWATDMLYRFTRNIGFQASYNGTSNSTKL